jgi:hypothetical protein
VTVIVAKQHVQQLHVILALIALMQEHFQHRRRRKLNVVHLQCCSAHRAGRWLCGVICTS